MKQKTRAETLADLATRAEEFAPYGLAGLLRERVLNENFVAAQFLFGDTTTEGLRWLSHAFDVIPTDQRRQCLEGMWTGGQWGEKAWAGRLCGHDVRPMGHRSLTRRVVDLFRFVPECRLTIDQIPNQTKSKTIDVYRGVCAGNRRGALTRLYAPSWTLSREAAECSATRGPNEWPSFVGSARIRRDHVLAYLDCRDEAEVIVDPLDLSRQIVERIDRKDRTDGNTQRENDGGRRRE